MRLLRLTEEEWQFLRDTLALVRDDGPEFAGWVSRELQDLRTVIDQAPEET